MSDADIRKSVMAELKKLFRPEFLNRVDDTIVFTSLSSEQVRQIAELMVDDLRQRLIARGMSIQVTDAAYDCIAREGTDASMGARPLRRALQRLVEDPLSEELLMGRWKEGDIILVDCVAGELVFAPGEGEVPAPREALSAASGPVSSLLPASSFAGGFAGSDQAAD